MKKRTFTVLIGLLTIATFVPITLSQQMVVPEPGGSTGKSGTGTIISYTPGTGRGLIDPDNTDLLAVPGQEGLSFSGDYCDPKQLPFHKGDRVSFNITFYPRDNRITPNLYAAAFPNRLSKDKDPGKPAITGHPPDNNPHQGTVVNYSENRAFGTIRPDEANLDPSGATVSFEYDPNNKSQFPFRQNDRVTFYVYYKMSSWTPIVGRVSHIPNNAEYRPAPKPTEVVPMSVSRGASDPWAKPQAALKDLAESEVNFRKTLDDVAQQGAEAAALNQQQQDELKKQFRALDEEMAARQRDWAEWCEYQKAHPPVVFKMVDASDLRIGFPPSGATIDESPFKVKLDFNQPVKDPAGQRPGEGLMSWVRVSRQLTQMEINGTQPRKPLQMDNKDLHLDPTDPRRVIVSVPPLAPGTYTVDWFVNFKDKGASKGKYQITIKEAGADDPATPQHPILQALNRVFESSQKDTFKTYALNNSANSDCITGMWLAKGEAKIYSVPLSAGVEYAIVGGGDDNVGKFDLKLLDANGKNGAVEGDAVVSFDSQGGKQPAIVFTPRKDGRFGVRMALQEVNGGKDNACCALAILRKSGGAGFSKDLPMVNFKTAAKLLAARVARCIEANNNNAELMNAGFSIHGVVLPKNGIAANLYYGPASTFDPKQETVVIVSGDGNLNPISVYTSGSLRAPKPAEQDDLDPMVLYQRVNQDGPMHMVANLSSNTSLVMIALVQVPKPK